ncbi:MAG: hypothetical protein JSS30_08100 [Verrucomicrobia bacterium]|nr:hypothetical protein [Verrucomicrobiota bacterium]
MQHVECDAFYQKEGSTHDFTDDRFKGELPLYVLDLNGSMAVIAVEMHPLTDKIVKVAHRVFPLGTEKPEIESFLSTLNRNHTYIYLIGGGSNIKTAGFPLQIRYVIDDYMDFPDLVTKTKVNDWLFSTHSDDQKKHFQFISAALQKDGTLVYCLHDSHFSN